MDRPGIFPVRILSLPTPAFAKILPLSHSVALSCHFLQNNRMVVRTSDVPDEMRCRIRRIFAGARRKTAQSCKIIRLLSRMQVETSLDFPLQVQIRVPRWSSTAFMMQVAKGEKTCHYAIYLMLETTVC